MKSLYENRIFDHIYTVSANPSYNPPGNTNYVFSCVAIMHALTIPWASLGQPSCKKAHLITGVLCPLFSDRFRLFLVI